MSRTLLLCSLALLMSAGCRSVDVHPDDRLPSLIIQTRWQIQLTEQPVLAYFPKETAAPVHAKSGRVVIAGSEAGHLVAADSRSGKELWRFKTHGKIRGAATVSGKDVYFGATDGKLYRVAVDTGELSWKAPYETQGAITSAPAIGSGLVVFQNNQNRTYAVDWKTGEYKWDTGRSRPEFLTIKGEGGATIKDGFVYAGYEDGFLTAVRAKDGATLWSKNLSGSESQFVDVDTRPVVLDDTVFAASFNVGLYAVGRKHGNIRWLHKARGIVTPALSERSLILTTGLREIIALNPATGVVQWTTKIGYGELGEPLVRGERLWVPTGDGLVMMDAARGKIMARISPDDGLNARVAANGSWLHMLTNNGALVGARLLR